MPSGRVVSPLATAPFANEPCESDDSIPALRLGDALREPLGRAILPPPEPYALLAFSPGQPLSEHVGSAILPPTKKPGGSAPQPPPDGQEVHGHGFLVFLAFLTFHLALWWHHGHFCAPFPVEQFTWPPTELHYQYEPSEYFET